MRLMKIFFSIWFCAISLGFAQNEKSYSGMFNINDEMNIQIKDDRVKIHVFSFFTGESTDKIIDLKKDMTGKVTYFFIDGKKFLCLSNDVFFYLYDKNDVPVFDGYKYGFMKKEFIMPLSGISASSCLTEGKTEYSSSDLTDKIGKPWVEGKSGNGIGEYLSFEVLKHEELYISIGFIDYNKPNLYEENSRPKKLKIYLDDSFYKVVTLEDTPDFQKLPVKIEKDGIMKIEIIEVYEGTKYQDTCINMLLSDKNSCWSE